MKSMFKPSRTLGLCISRQHVGVLELRRAAASWQVETFSERELPTAMFDLTTSASAMDGLRRSLADLTAGLGSAYMPVHVALADPAVRAAVFELEDLPKSPAAQLQLAQFRFSRESVVESPLTCVSQALGSVPAQSGARGALAQVLFGMSIDSRWHEALQGVLQECGVVAWGIAPGALQRFNLFHDRFTASSGALLSVERSSWALLLWDERTRLRHCSAHWRDSAKAAAGEDHQAIVSEAARVIVAYADAHAEHSIKQIYISGGLETEAIATTLDRRAHTPCVRLSMADLVTGYDQSLQGSNTGEGALCAALTV